MWKEIEEMRKKRISKFNKKKKYKFSIGNYIKKRLWKIKVFFDIYISFKINCSIILIN